MFSFHPGLVSLLGRVSPEIHVKRDDEDDDDDEEEYSSIHALQGSSFMPEIIITSVFEDLPPLGPSLVDGSLQDIGVSVVAWAAARVSVW